MHQFFVTPGTNVVSIVREEQAKTLQLGLLRGYRRCSGRERCVDGVSSIDEGSKRRSPRPVHERNRDAARRRRSARLARRVRDFRLAIEPLQRELAKLLAMQLPAPVLLTANGGWWTSDPEVHRTASFKACADLHRQIIRQIAR
jgi:hypothetical protein